MEDRQTDQPTDLGIKAPSRSLKNTPLLTHCLDSSPSLHDLSCACIFKLRLGAFIPRSVGRSVGRSVCLSSKNYKKIIKLYKTSHNLSITFLKTVKAALAVCRSFLDGVVIFFNPSLIDYALHVYYKSLKLTDLARFDHTI